MLANCSSYPAVVCLHCKRKPGTFTSSLCHQYSLLCLITVRLQNNYLCHIFLEEALGSHSKKHHLPLSIASLHIYSNFLVFLSPQIMQLVEMLINVWWCENSDLSACHHDCKSNQHWCRVFPEKPIFFYKFCKTIYFTMLTLIYESLLKKWFCNNRVGNSTFICKLTSLKCAKFPKQTFG